MIFSILWTILLGIVGGVISSIIVSRIFFIQGEYQQQIKFVDGIIRKLGAISAFIQVMKSVLEASYDAQVKKEKEMKEKGYETEAEYYAAHSDKNWIHEDIVLDKINIEIKKVTTSIHTDMMNNPVNDNDLIGLLRRIQVFCNKATSKKEYTFSVIKELEEEQSAIVKQYDTCMKVSGKKLFSLVKRDKVMIITFILVVVLIAATILCHFLGV